MIYDGYRREWWRYRAVSWPGMGEGRDLGLYTGGAVELSALSDMRAQGTLDYAGEVPRRGELVRIYYGFADDSGASTEAPVGTFFVSPGDPSLGGAVVTGTAELESMLKPALAGGYGRPYVVAAGSDPVAEANAIFSRLGLATNGATSSRRLASDVVYDPDDKWITIANDLLSRAGYAGAYPDAWGSIVMEPYRDPSERPVAWRFRDGDGAIMLPAVTMRDSVGKANNVVSMTYEGDEETIWAQCRNVDPESAASIPSVGYAVSTHETVSELAGTTVQAREAELAARCREKVVDEASVVEYVDWGWPWLPLSPNDAIEIDYSSERLLWRGAITSMRMNVGGHCHVDASARRFVRRDLAVEEDSATW